MITHKIFVTWLIYAVVVILIGLGLFYLHIPQITIISDHSYLTTVLLGMYGISEILSAIQAWKMSRQQVIADNVNKWLHSNTLIDLKVNEDGSVVLISSDKSYIIPNSETALHFSALKDMSAGGNHVDQSTLLDVLDDRLHGSVNIIEFVAGRIVWVGILATILGVILAFWPLLSAGMAIEAIRLKLGGFFSGIAVAFIPTAASFVFKIALDFGTKILSSGAAEIANTLARVGETKILPVLQENARK